MIWLLILALLILGLFIAAGVDDTRHNRAAATPDRHRHRRTNGGNQ